MEGNKALQDLPGAGISMGREAKSATWSPTDGSGSTAEAAGGWAAGWEKRPCRLEQGAESLSQAQEYLGIFMSSS